MVNVIVSLGWIMGWVMSCFVVRMILFGHIMVILWSKYIILWSMYIIL